jgi:hypothetical protein
MTPIPTDYIKLREAIIRLTNKRAPDVKARDYLGASSVRMINGWMVNEHNHRVGRGLMRPEGFQDFSKINPWNIAWNAIDSSRLEIHQALVDAVFPAIVRDQHSGNLHYIDAGHWGANRGLDTIGNGFLAAKSAARVSAIDGGATFFSRGGVVLLQEQVFSEWMEGRWPRPEQKQGLVTDPDKHRRKPGRPTKDGLARLVAEFHRRHAAGEASPENTVEASALLAQAQGRGWELPSESTLAKRIGEERRGRT